MQTVQQSIYPIPPVPSSKGLGFLSVLVIVACLVGLLASAYYFATTKIPTTTISPTYTGPECQGLSKAIVRRNFQLATTVGNQQTNVSGSCQYQYEIQMNSECFQYQIPGQAVVTATKAVFYCNGTSTEQNLQITFEGSLSTPFVNSITCQLLGGNMQNCTVGASIADVPLLSGGYFVDGGGGTQNIKQGTAVVPVPNMVDCTSEVTPATPLFLCSSEVLLRWDSVVAQTFGIVSLVFTIATAVARQLFSSCCHKDNSDV